MEKTKDKKVSKKAENKKKHVNRFSLFTVIILLLLIFVPLILITTDMRYAPFRDNVFAQEFLSSNVDLDDISIYVGEINSELNTDEVELNSKQKVNMIKMLSQLKVRKQKFLQLEQQEGLYVKTDHEYIKIVNNKTEKVIKIRMEGSAMEVQGYSYLVNDSLKTAEINYKIIEILSYK